MLVVIFKARLRALDAAQMRAYSTTAQRMRDLALNQFGCIDFHAVTEAAQEVALSYWADEHCIRAWREHPEHVEAQRRGRQEWYESYSVDVAEVVRSYRLN